MRRVKVVTGVSLVLICLLLFMSKTAFVVRKSRYNPNNLLRLHVIANSNTLADQLLKRKVRDAIIASSQDLLTNITNISQAKERIANNLDYLSKVAQREINQSGKDYQVKLNVGEFKFPTRSYGNLTLAAGSYQALEVVIGDGAGANWWCVLFPPLCFVDSVDNLSAKKVNLTSRQAKNLEVKFKFKLVEYLNENAKLIKSNLKLGNIFSKSN
ncbi:stage II sporulation protein R [Halobacteroides halobius DSM 5150]|uniref:Stage II sporulation protein R n=1 Tax=Halobacteroides halobius (strain ATCC 35273 / DSM 5150 / MD-1) TaxID=748449 RepID=L0KDI1_HALHC|nr:stage II sporulation protein R [Halobacteroides halobius]AGB42429.1 stage II sporulation protein R [Halobacteroides halobius DSM 5150]